MPIIWTAPSLSEPRGRHVTVSWQAFADRCRAPRSAADKDSLPRWAPVEFRGAYRCRANVLRCHAVVLDVDDGSPLVLTPGLTALAHSTFSSTEGAPRWRIVYPLSRPVDGEEYERVWRWLAQDVEAAGGRPDYAARDASRCWAVPAIPPSGWYQLRTKSGRPASVTDALAAIPAEEPPVAPTLQPRDNSYDRRAERARKYLAAMDPSISGSGGHLALFRAAVAMVRGFALDPDDALALLASEFNPRCQPEWIMSDLRHKVRSALQRGKMAFGELAGRRG